MNCQRFEDIVNDLARQQIVEAHAREQALLHSAGCETCAQRLNDERQLTFALKALATDAKSAVMPPRIEEHLRQAFRSRTFSRPPKRAAGRLDYWIVAAAAVLLIVFGITATRLRLAQSVEQKPSSIGATTPKAEEKNPAPFDKAPNSASVPGNQNGTGSKDEHLSRKVSPSHRNRLARARAEKAVTPVNYNETEIATGFMPLGYFTQLNLEEGGQLVRVEVSRSAMMSLGLPVNMERYGERVKADVLLGSDGLARAIRFVQ